MARVFITNTPSVLPAMTQWLFISIDILPSAQQSCLHTSAFEVLWPKPSTRKTVTKTITRHVRMSPAEMGQIC